MEPIGSVEAILRQKGHDVWAVTPDATVFEALKLMAQKNVGALLVMEDDKLVGVMSERDYSRKIALLGKQSRETPVGDILTSMVITVGPENTIPECMRLMIDHRIRHLPVVAGAKVVGVISMGDLVNWTIKAQSATIAQLESYISGKYPA
jgi:CBS domain-containing protein